MKKHFTAPGIIAQMGLAMWVWTPPAGNLFKQIEKIARKLEFIGLPGHYSSSSKRSVFSQPSRGICVFGKIARATSR